MALSRAYTADFCRSSSSRWTWRRKWTKKCTHVKRETIKWTGLFMTPPPSTYCVSIIQANRECISDENQRDIGTVAPRQERQRQISEWIFHISQYARACSSRYSQKESWKHFIKYTYLYRQWNVFAVEDFEWKCWNNSFAVRCEHFLLARLCCDFRIFVRPSCH